ncbi:AAA family ATPase [Williamsia sp. Leaf354]|jgi:hypothetical protein|uniref:AAA family ATPase n=1 Tax=Williamsia sp. Leaf354 TaxID=1736349 RepID=UPI0009E82576|nr:AAA family ATPase [Williamsia sp. Leaf354]
MYLHYLSVRNSGPVRQLDLEFTFNEDDTPIPHVLVGRNGSGKTNILSIVADALMQGASSAFSDVLAPMGVGKSYFRILGGPTTTYQETYGVSVLKFREASQTIFFHEKSGEIDSDLARTTLPEVMHEGITWSGSAPSKAVQLDDDRARNIFENGVYVYFPSSRSEKPSWFNEGSIITDNFDLKDQYRQNLGRPLFVEHGIEDFAQWLLGVLTESRLAVDPVLFDAGETSEVLLRADTTVYSTATRTLGLANQILQTVMDDESATFVWAGRKNARKVGVISESGLLAAGLDSLSGGQATLLALFGTMLRYADAAELEPETVPGIVVVDELDAHMHIDLQLRSLPKLISLFPKIQFILSSHSPFFALGMERQFSASGVRVFELSSRMPVSAEAYQEFQNALNAFRETERFGEVVQQAVQSGNRPVVFVAGQTDLRYFQTASNLLGYPDLSIMFDWIGKDDPLGGSFTGDASLDQMLKFLKANPSFPARTVVIVYDCDAKARRESFQSVHVLPLIEVPGAHCEKGIENLLPSSVFTADVFDTTERKTGYGATNTIRSLNKALLCERVCGNEAQASTFANFAGVLAEIDTIVQGGTEPEPG